MALQGTLDTFSLPDVLRLLSTTSKTGRLRIDGDRGQGSVWLADGGIVDADADRAVAGTPTDEVVFELLRFTSGSFAFDGDDRASGGGKPEDVESLLRRANSLLSEWSELEAVVPSLEHEVSLAADLSTDEVTIDADRWRSLVAVASGRTVGELATSLGLTELGVSRAVRELVDLGVAEVDAPGTVSHAPRRGSAPDLGRRPAPAVPEPDAVGGIGRPAPAPVASESSQRAGWLRTGEMPAVGPDRRSSSASNGQARGSLDDTVATPAPPPAPPPAEPPGKGGLTSRLGRGRNASAGPPARGAEPPTTGPTRPVSNGSARPSARGAEPPTTGPTRPVSNGSARPPARTPVTPPARTNDAGRPRNGATDAGATARHDLGAPRRSPADGPERSSGPSRPRSPGGPTPAAPRGGPSPFDGGRLGPPPRDTGQIPPVSPSSLPPDLHWAADDTGSGTFNGGPPTSPFSGLSNLGPTRPVPSDGEIAPHVAAMSPEARAAVQATVGNAGGSAPGRGAGQGDDIAQRGRLISFLSTVR